MFLYREKYFMFENILSISVNLINVELLGQILSIFHMTEISKQCEHLLNLVCVYFKILVSILFMSVSVYVCLTDLTVCR